MESRDIIKINHGSDDCFMDIGKTEHKKNQTLYCGYLVNRSCRCMGGYLLTKCVSYIYFIQLQRYASSIQIGMAYTKSILYVECFD